jgi:hypothetical protein
MNQGEYLDKNSKPIKNNILKMFGAIKGYFFGGSQNESSNSSKESKPLKSDISNNNLDSNKNELKKRTIIKGEKNKFDFSEEYDEDEPKQSTSPSISSNSPSNKNNLVNFSLIQNTKDIDYWRMAHCVFVKNSLIDINTLNYVPFIKLKKKQEGLLSYIGFGGSDTSFDEVKYLAGFDEHFIYMINLSKEENKDEKDEKKIVGNHYDITKITNIEIIEENTRILVTILFVLDNDVDNFNSKIKKFYLEKQNAFKFLSMLKAYLNNYKTKITFTDKVFGNINFNEIPKEENIVDRKEINDNANEQVKENSNQKKDKENGNDSPEEEKKEKEPKNEENEDEIFTDENVEDKVEDKKYKENKKDENKKDEKDEENKKDESDEEKKEENNEKEQNTEKQNKNLIDI